VTVTHSPFLKECFTDSPDLRKSDSATKIAFVKNQPSPSLIDLSPLSIGHPKTLRRSWVRPNLGPWTDHLVSGESPFYAVAFKRGPLAGPLYKRYVVTKPLVAPGRILLLFNLNLVLFHHSLAVLVHYRSA